MYLYLFVNLNKGDLCKVTDPHHPRYGHIIRFAEIEYYLQSPCFVFEEINQQQERIVLHKESQFETLPFKDSLQFLINLAIETKDREWFEDLTYKLCYESQ
ncbi:hypothetical protein [Ammoniphilus sp. YIM 78166]|uniref:hypothetical protein n=1 Tax=Ammoniphilus sp. YIM 78166 TaxID=1644106 RepID=UPI00106F501F|nr:hypothetical protein [Ammoniphilus sp. YIM 78166]